MPSLKESWEESWPLYFMFGSNWLETLSVLASHVRLLSNLFLRGCSA